MREANSAEVARNAERDRQASLAQSDAEGRNGLAAAARHGLQGISEALRTVIAEAAPAGRMQTDRGGEWSLQLGDATLSPAGLTETAREPWRWQAPAFEVIAHTELAIRFPESRLQYAGRAHSLWFCDGFEEGLHLDRDGFHDQPHDGETQQGHPLRSPTRRQGSQSALEWHRGVPGCLAIHSPRAG